MSEISCNRSIVLSNYLSSDAMSRVYVNRGPAAGISNKYYYSNDTCHLVDLEDQGTFIFHNNYPADGVLFSIDFFVCFFLCFFISNITRKQLERFA